jgi:hypothetical protein
MVALTTRRAGMVELTAGFSLNKAFDAIVGIADSCSPGIPNRHRGKEP